MINHTRNFPSYYAHKYVYLLGHVQISTGNTINIKLPLKPRDLLTTGNIGDRGDKSVATSN